MAWRSCIFLWLCGLFHVCCVDTISGASQYIQGAGGTLPWPLFQKAFLSYRFIQDNVQNSFWASSGDQALCRLLNYSKECDPSDTSQPLVIDWYSVASLPRKTAYQSYPDLQMYPTLASPVVPMYNLNGVTNLVLTLETLAKIWSGRIRTWDHPDIQATNPNFTQWRIPANQSITLVGRAETNGVTRVFKEALAAVDPIFNALVGKSSAPTFLGKLVLQNLAQPVISYVMRNPYTLSYAPMGDALVNQVPIAQLNRSGVIVAASAISVQYAVMELGLSFGNNGDDPAHLTSNIYGAVNPLAWPIALYSYIVVRKATLRPGATCATVAALVDFWLWFWESGDVDSLATSLGFSVLPDLVKQHVVARFKQDMRCGGRLVWQAPEVLVLQGHGPSMAIPIFDTFRQVYALVNSSVALNYTALPSEAVDYSLLLGGGAFVVTTAPLAAPGVFSLALGSEVLGVVSQFAVTLDGLTLAKVLNGDIQTWLHPAIVALNPTGIVDMAGRALNDTAQRIVLLQGPTARSAPLAALLQRYYPAYTGAAIAAAESFADEVLLRSSVIGTPYSLSVSALVGQLPQELQVASLVSAAGTAVAPTAEATRGCFSAGPPPHPGTNSKCYPLLLTLYISLQRRCPSPPAHAPAVAFLQWMFTEATLAAALDALNLVSLYETSDAIQVANDEALFQLSCQVRPVVTDPLPVLLGIIIPISVVVLLGLVSCGWWVWRITEYNRMLRKKFSNDNVAESCAEAIAHFDLDAVAWLRDVKEPNKIQLAFLGIVALLTEVKPYIPDQLLSRLTAKKSATDDEEIEPQSAPASPVAKDTNTLLPPSADEPKRRSRLFSVALRKGSTMLPNGRPGHMYHRGTIASAEVVAMRDWTRKRCTYLCVRFGSTYPNAEKRLPALVRVAGRIVDVAKAHGATIDAVGVDVVNVHWGVASSSGASVRAVQAGLELAKLRETLPEDEQGAFSLQIGIGKGPCDCGTVSSESGHRFFVVWGAEASLAIEVAMASLPKQVLATVLVSPAVFQEVQFTVQCLPRLWHGDVLLWEPVALLRKDDDDEWMYELQKMGDAVAVFQKLLLEVFLLSKDKAASAADLSVRIAALQDGGLSPQDAASLDRLLATATAHPRPTADMVLDECP